MFPSLVILAFIIGLILVVFSAENLVEGIVGTSIGFGLSAFFVSTVFVGFDPENLGVGAIASLEQVTGITWGSILGAFMVGNALALGITLLFTKLEFEEAPKKILFVPILGTLLLFTLSLDGLLTRLDGLILLGGFGLFVLYLYKLTKEGINIEPSEEIEESLEEVGEMNRWRSLGVFILSLVGMIFGSELLVDSSKMLVSYIGVSKTFFGMTILALLVSIEELAKELPAAVKGRPDITFGNVLGSVLAFFLFNTGIIALIRPLPVFTGVLGFYFPLVFLTIGTTTVFMFKKEIPRWVGAVFIALYLIFALGRYVR